MQTHAYIWLLLYYIIEMFIYYVSYLANTWLIYIDCILLIYYLYILIHSLNLNDIKPTYTIYEANL